LVHDEAIDDLATDGTHRGERPTRILEAHCGASAAVLREVLWRGMQYVEPVEGQRARHRSTTGQSGDDGAGDHALAPAALTDETHHLAAVDVQVHIGKRLYPTDAVVDVNRQAFDLQEVRRVHDTFRSARSCSASPMRLKPSTHTASAMPGGTDVHH